MIPFLTWLNDKVTTDNHQIKVGNLMVDVVRKDIKNLHLAVYPPLGRIRVAAPLRVNDEAVRLAVISRMSWIKKQKSKFTNQARQSEREYVTCLLYTSPSPRDS